MPRLASRPPIERARTRPLTQEALWQIVAAALRPGDVVLADQGTSFYGWAATGSPTTHCSSAQPLWASIGYTLPATARRGVWPAPDRRPVLLIGDGAAQLDDRRSSARSPSADPRGHRGRRTTTATPSNAPSTARPRPTTTSRPGIGSCWRGPSRPIRERLHRAGYSRTRPPRSVTHLGARTGPPWCTPAWTGWTCRHYLNNSPPRAGAANTVEAVAYS